MASACFKFKQFTVWHDRCAMKVGTDGVLLGAWCPVGEFRGSGALISPEGSNDYSQANVQEFRSASEPLNSEASKHFIKVLDIGTGSGLIALMLAQRIEKAQITAIDIDNGAVEQAKYNFEQSLWADRLECQQVALQELKGENIYDLIVSNPPYFQDSLKNPDSQRAMARHTDTLSYEELLKHSARLLTNNGIIALVLPIEAEKQIIVLAKQYQLYPTHLTYVYPKPGKAAKRLLIALQAYPPPFPEYTTKCHVHFQDPRKRKGTKLDDLTLESESAPRSEAYKELTKEFYL